LLHQVLNNMFHMPLPWLEKILRPIVVYLALVVLLRLFGKRELAQLNPFDLVVLLSLSNTVQNAIIGDDNSVSGGIIGAISLLAINWLLLRVVYQSPKMMHILEGKETVLIRGGRIDHIALKRELLSHEDLMIAVHKQGFAHPDDVERCVLEPGGGFYMEGRKPSHTDSQHIELVTRLTSLENEIRDLRKALGNA
jgi:uncharacterized membrane protein YcaP (DUF421 family)